MRGRASASSSDQSQSCHACSNVSCAPTASSTVKFGSSAASSGRSRSRLDANAWIVSMCAPSTCCRARRSRSASTASADRNASYSSRRTRSRRSPAAFSVNVIATISRSSARPRRTASTTRPTSTDVLPVPAPARRKIDVSRSRIAASRTAWSLGAWWLGAWSLGATPVMAAAPGGSGSRAPSLGPAAVLRQTDGPRRWRRRADSRSRCSWAVAGCRARDKERSARRGSLR